MSHRTEKKERVDGLAILAFIAVMFMMALLQGGAARVVQMAVWTGQRIEAEHTGQIVVTDGFYKALVTLKNATTDREREEAKRNLEGMYSKEARDRQEQVGGTREDNEKFLREAIIANDASKFLSDEEAEPGLNALGAGTLPSLLGSLMLLWWFVMMIFQGEGLELDLQRRRHPMWEWLFSHPVPPGAIFFAEMLSPIAANPVYCTTPFFWGSLYGFVYGTPTGILAGFVIGVPMAIALACLGKALEISVVLRFPARSRGAILGLMSWIGYASLMAFILSIAAMGKIASLIGTFLRPVADIHAWPYLALALGVRADGSLSFLFGAILCLAVGGFLTILAVWCALSGASKGIAGTFEGSAESAGAPPQRVLKLGRDPLYRKELTWFWRDRSAIVQYILIPLSLAAVQLLHFRSVVQHAGSNWHYLSGAAVLFGTYFLWILGPRSLASEGPALWLALTWPRGLENLLKAKAKLWSWVATGIVLLILIYAFVRFPNDSWKIALVAGGWVAFGRSMAEKAVTLVSAPTSSGEPEKIPTGRRWAASLGVFTFAIGVVTQQWHLAIMGIVYSWVTAAAMWQNFRARLPYLYDPWSEKLPQPPTLMHAMIAISALVELGAVVMLSIILIFGSAGLAAAQTIAYGITAFFVMLFVTNFLQDRNVSATEVWCWNDSASAVRRLRCWCGDGQRGKAFFACMVIGVVSGVVLGGLAVGYTSLLMHLPSIGEMLRQSEEHMAKMPGLRISNAIIAIVFAPFAEEYLFRGLLFKALDREWGGWRAVVGSAAFFAIYHHPFAWVPVGLVGAINALLFKHTGRLAPAVLLHAAYNAVVVCNW